MKYDVLVTKEEQDGYVARALAFPDIVVCGEEEAAVLQKVQEAIAQKLTSGRVVQVEVPTANGQPPTEEEHPWLRFAGMFKDDPDWEQYQEDLRRYRDEANREELPIE